MRPLVLVVLALGLFSLTAVEGCQKQGLLPGQSDVPPLGHEGASAGGCETQVKDGSTELESMIQGWLIVLPGDAWELDCSDSARITAKLSSTLGESLLLTVTFAPDAPLDERQHLDTIHVRAKRVLPRAGARLAKPRIILAGSGSAEKTVFVYQVLAEAFEQQQMVSYHGWAVLRTSDDGAYEFHLNAASKKRLDWPKLLAEVLGTTATVKR